MLHILGIYKRHCPLMLNLYKFDINRLPLVDILLILVPSIELYTLLWAPYTHIVVQPVAKPQASIQPIISSFIFETRFLGIIARSKVHRVAVSKANPDPLDLNAGSGSDKFLLVSNPNLTCFNYFSDFRQSTCT